MRITEPSGTRAAAALLPSLLLTLAAGGAQAAESFPSRPIRMIVPFSAGGASDGPARIYAAEMNRLTGQQMLVENRPGAGSVLGAEIAAKSTPDGYTLFMISNTHYVSAAIHRKLPYDAIADFTAITGLTAAQNILVVHPSLGVRTVKELIALAKKRPGAINWASSGNGGTQHLTGSLFASMAGIDMVHVPYRGSGPATADLLAGQVGVGFPGIAGMVAFVQSGKLRALGVSASRRSPLMPEVPTIAEAGVPGFELVPWFGLSGPRGVPEPIVSTLHKLSLKAIAATTPAMAQIGQEPFTHASPAEFAAFQQQEAPKWAKLARASGATID
ncbi:MAG: tripartite tricarboxylate transporter substrate binding protein [Betaproteobacteria bacterium]|nr:tripartite tricarboxylate transporter substrate binding protein [Betaproteobacteria bacterium]